MIPSLVSVVVPVYNGERFLGQALHSVLRQSYRPMEVIVVDDGSTDGSAAVATGFSGVQQIRQTNRGVAAARNFGIQSAEGEFVAFLDQDDLWDPDKLTAQVDALRADGRLGYVVSLERLFLEPGTHPPHWLRPGVLDHAVTAFEPSALLARRSVFDEVGLFDTSYAMGSDVDWFFRAKDRGVPMAVIQHVLLRRRIHSGNQSHATERSARDLRRVVRSAMYRRSQRP